MVHEDIQYLQNQSTEFKLSMRFIVLYKHRLRKHFPSTTHRGQNANEKALSDVFKNHDAKVVSINYSMVCKTIHHSEVMKCSNCFVFKVNPTHKIFKVPKKTMTTQAIRSQVFKKRVNQKLYASTPNKKRSDVSK